MLNKVWFGLIAIGIVYGFCRAAVHDLRGEPVASTAASMEKGSTAATSTDDGASAAERSTNADEATGSPPIASSPRLKGRGLLEMGKDLNQAALDAAETSVSLCIGLVGIMALWLGLLSVAKDAGLVDALARLLRPLMRWLFPEVPDGHPAQGAMLMNISANMLGLENAATPLGLKAMKELQTLNPDPDTATNSMAMFLTINTSNVTLIPFTIIGYRALKGSEYPAGPLFAILLTTSIATIVGVATARLLSRLPRYAASDPTIAAATPPDSSVAEKA